MRKVIFTFLVVVILFVLLLLFNTLRFKANQLVVNPIDVIEVSAGASNRLAEAISIRTTSFESQADFDTTQFQQFNAFLLEKYPNVFAKCKHQIFNQYSHLLEWEGTDSSLEPIILMAHLDAVPIASPALWTFHPYTIGVKNDTIYGRGTIDDKSSLIGILEATEKLMVDGFVPQRTVMISLGHDEEVLGTNGAVAIAEYLERRDTKALFVLDEGLAIVERLIPGMDDPVAMIGVAEKGFVSVELTVVMKGGHSSTPEKESSIDVLSKAISTLKTNPFPAVMTPALEHLLDKIGPNMSFMTRLALANRFLFKSQVLDSYEKTPAGNAMIRTTTSPTIFEAGIKDNVIPVNARAVVNFRIIPGENIESVLSRITELINDDRVGVRAMSNGSNPSDISPIDHDAYRVIERSIKEVNSDVLVAPGIVVGATDSRHFNKVSDKVYKFAPYRVNPKNLNCFHGIDERIAVKVFEDAIRFYTRLIINAQS